MSLRLLLIAEHKNFPTFSLYNCLYTRAEVFLLLFSFQRGEILERLAFMLRNLPEKNTSESKSESNESLKFIIRRSEVNRAASRGKIKVVSYGKTQAQAEKYNFPAE
jgi:replication-associated recombination protein RarA